MNRQEFQILCNQIADEVESLLPEYLKNPEDAATSRGGSALAILNAQGESYGRMFGDIPSRQRECAQTAWKKANQVWLTGYATGQFETLVYSKEIDENQFGISRPEYIGWIGGVEAKTLSGARLILAFSGMRGEQDVAILKEAANNLKSFVVLDW
jgi:glc operon protein GlcG